MSMSKRDFETVARVLRYHRDLSKADPHAQEVLNDVVADLGTAFASANERFDISRFVLACGVPE